MQQRVVPSKPPTSAGNGVTWNIGERKKEAAEKEGGEGENAFSKFQEKMKEHGDAVNAVEAERKREAERQHLAEEERRKELEKKQSEERMNLSASAQTDQQDDLF